MSRSSDHGDTWTAPVPLNTNADSDSGSDAYVHVTTDRAGNWVAVWKSNDPLGGTIGADSDILVSRSTDAGATWTAPVVLNSFADVDNHDDQRPKIATDGAGVWIAVWDSVYSTSGPIDSDVYLARSTDAGATWTAATFLNTNAGSDSGNDFYPSVTADGAGGWVAVWHSSDTLGDSIGVDDDVLVSHSTNAGVTWTAPVPLNTNADSDSGHDIAPKSSQIGPATGSSCGIQPTPWTTRSAPITTFLSPDPSTPAPPGPPPLL